MNVEIKGCKDTILREKLINATFFFANELLTSQMLPHISLNIVMKSTMRDLGCCSVTHYNSWYKPRTFQIELRRHRSYKTTLMTLAHEMVHVKQYAKGEINVWLNKWHKQKIDTDTVPYEQLPWEIEANTYERLLYNIYKEEK
jgi:hypothetical protein